MRRCDNYLCINKCTRFSEVARLKHVWWFEIRGTIRTFLLSSSTNYSAYLIFKMIGDTVLGLDIDPARVSIGVLGGSNQITHVCLDPHCGLHNFERWRTQVSPDMMGLKRPKKRNDGWYEAKLGEFFNEGSDDLINNDELEISCCETRGRVSKSDIIIEGIEIRPAKLVSFLVSALFLSFFSFIYYYYFFASQYNFSFDNIHNKQQYIFCLLY